MQLCRRGNQDYSEAMDTTAGNPIEMPGGELEFDDHAAYQYLDELIAQSSTGVQAALATKLAALGRGAISEVFSNAQSVANAAAMIAKILWPRVQKTSGETDEEWVRRKALAGMRGPALRKMLDLAGSSPLQNKDVRNAIEHFDERLDRRLASRDRNIVMFTMGPPNAVVFEGADKPLYLHHYDPATSIYTVLESQLNISEVEREMIKVLNGALKAKAEIEMRRLRPRKV